MYSIIGDPTKWTCGFRPLFINAAKISSDAWMNFICCCIFQLEKSLCRRNLSILISVIKEIRNQVALLDLICWQRVLNAAALLWVSGKLRRRKLKPQTSNPENSDFENSDPENSDLENSNPSKLKKKEKKVRLKCYNPNCSPMVTQCSYTTTIGRQIYPVRLIADASIKDC